MSFLKRIFAPIQARVLAKKLCPACTLNLDKQRQREPIDLENELVTCNCGRTYIYNRPHKRYRRALPADLKQFFPPVSMGYREN